MKFQNIVLSLILAVATISTNFIDAGCCNKGCNSCNTTSCNPCNTGSCCPR